MGPFDHSVYLHFTVIIVHATPPGLWISRFLTPFSPNHSSHPFFSPPRLNHIARQTRLRANSARYHEATSMSSQKQIDANRLNAQKSTGPNTPEGRDAVRFNALRHDLTAKHAVLENENEQEFQEMLEAFEAEHQPTGPTENLLVQQMVMAAWRLQRLRALETGLFNLRMCDLSKQTQITYKQLSDAERQAFVFLDDSRHAGAIENLSRYETRIERSFYRALRELQRLRKNRGAGLQPASPQAESRIEPGSATPAPLSTDAVPSPDSRLLNSDVSGLLIPDSALPATRASRSSYEFCRTKPIPSGKGTGTEAERESEEPQVSRMRRSAGV